MVSDSDFNISDQRLADLLEISLEELYSIIDFFDKDPDDEWDIKENEDFIFLNQTLGIRAFSEQGAFAIARYKDCHETINWIERLKEWITKHRQKIREAFVRQNIYQNIGSLVTKNDRYFILKKDIKNIFRTSYPKLSSVFQAIQRSNLPLEKGVDFDDINGDRFYSLNALYRFSLVLSGDQLDVALTDKARRDWCFSVEQVGKDVFNRIQKEDKKQFQQAQNYVKNTRDKKTCQVTGKKQTAAKPHINVAVHHLFSKEHYPAIKTDPDNMITIETTLHKNFHAWNGGTSAPCTIDDFIRFVNEQYPDYVEASHRLNLLRIKLYNKASTLKEGLRLPPSR